MDPALDLSSLPVVPLLGLAVVFCIAAIVVYGFAMKWSLSLAGCGQHGFGWSFCVSFAAGMSSGLVSVVLAFFADAMPPVLPFVLAIAAAVLTVAVMTRSGPISAGVAYLAFIFIGGLGMMVTAVVMGLASFVFVDMREFAKAAQSMRPDMMQDAEATNDDANMWATMPSQLDNAFFEGEETVSEISALGETSLDRDEGVSALPYHDERMDDASHNPHAQRKSKPNSVQVNPFVHYPKNKS
ncbi:MAG: hypothetical protein ACF8AM_15435 [Rhodopirellula sp. JB055]|uniref:hypothetical protein n=1 Tax=Rhodopirellula sp. JB055 TaxID=3342846 RepID=UPI00370A3406